MTRETILLSKINPYNDRHGKIPNKEHRDGIEKLKVLIKKGRPILPILIKKVFGHSYKYHRLDGYKRYFAFKELGYETIECFINGKRGGQDGMSWIDPDAEFNFDLSIVYPKDKDRIKNNYVNYNKYYNNKYHIILRYNPKKIIEIGVRAGYCAWVFLQACPTAKYFGFDNNKGKESGAKDLKYHCHAVKNLAEYDINIRSDFDTQKVNELPVKGQFVHIDGDHSYKGTIHDLNLAVRAKARYIFCLLYTSPSPRDATLSRMPSSA